MQRDEPAFPCGGQQTGVTIRDYFAAQFLGGVMGHTSIAQYNNLDEQARCVALAAYKFADAMIAERNKK